MLRCRHVNRRGTRANKAAPRADVTHTDCVAETCEQNPSSLTPSNDEAPRINVHVGIGGWRRNDQRDQDDQLSFDLSLSGNFGALASRVMEILGPYLRQAIADATVNISPQHAKPSETLAADSRSAPREVALSAGAKSLLKTIVDISNRCELQEHPDEAWISFSSWFIMTRNVERHRADAESLILELTNAGFVEVFNKSKRKQYKATVTGRRYLKSLNQS